MGLEEVRKWVEQPDSKQKERHQTEDGMKERADLYLLNLKLGGWGTGTVLTSSLVILIH